MPQTGVPQTGVPHGVPHGVPQTVPQTVSETGGMLTRGAHSFLGLEGVSVDALCVVEVHVVVQGRAATATKKRGVTRNSSFPTHWKSMSHTHTDTTLTHTQTLTLIHKNTHRHNTHTHTHTHHKQTDTCTHIPHNMCFEIKSLRHTHTNHKNTFAATVCF